MSLGGGIWGNWAPEEIDLPRTVGRLMGRRGKGVMRDEEKVSAAAGRRRCPCPPRFTDRADLRRPLPPSSSSSLPRPGPTSRSRPAGLDDALFSSSSCSPSSPIIVIAMMTRDYHGHYRPRNHHRGRHRHHQTILSIPLPPFPRVQLLPCASLLRFIFLLRFAVMSVKRNLAHSSG